MEETASSATTPARGFLPPPEGGGDAQFSDDGDDHSGYSSCEEGGSDLDRYCSANSALGSSASARSSVSFFSFFDSASCASFRSFTSGGAAKFAEDEFLPGGDCALIDPSQSPPPSAAIASEGFEVMALSERMDSLPRIRTTRRKPEASPGGSSSVNCNDLSGMSKLGRQADPSLRSAAAPGSNSVENGAYATEAERPAPDAIDVFTGTLESAIRQDFGSEQVLDPPIGLSSDHSQSAEENSISSCEHSEGEDSTLEYGTNHGEFIQERKNLQPAAGMKKVHQHALLMNSAVAFGSDDFDEFIQESGDGDLQSLTLFQDDQPWQPASILNSKGNVLSLATNHVTNSSLDGPGKQMDAQTVTRLAQDTDGHITTKELSYLNNTLAEPGFLHMEEAGKLSSEDQMNSVYSVAKGDKSSPLEVVETVASETIVVKQSASDLTSNSDSTGMQSSSTLARSYGATKFAGEDGNDDDDDERTIQPIIANGFSSFTDSKRPSSSKGIEPEDLHHDEVKNEDANNSYDEMVLDMEEILLDSEGSHGGRAMANRSYMNSQSHNFRDGSSTASTSGTDDTSLSVQPPSRIDWVEVIGAKQKKGDVSFGDRLVGVKEYTVYVLRVWSSNDNWEVERRYRDFFALYRKLRVLFNSYSLNLPSPWSVVERESRKFFGNASPNVISTRSVLIQDCLHSVLKSRYPFGMPSPLLCFLSPGELAHNSSLFKAVIPQALQKVRENQSSKLPNCRESLLEDVTELGKTVSLIVVMKPHKSIQQLLELQHYTCAGCHEPLDAGKTMLQGLVQTLGWKKPRFCEYTGQLFCASCHTNDTAVLPAKVLHLWDFSLYPVSQIAKAYLESIYDKPMLCVSAVNPFLFSKVPALLHVMGIRKNIGAMFPYVQCPFRTSILRGLGFRRYLLESNDFFALRDLVDLSKGAFSALPIMAETISSKILEHITQQCLVCYDSGVPCAARQSCDDPSSLIFPFQEADAAKCASCGSLFHTPCFMKLTTCPCGRGSSGKKNMSLSGRGSDQSSFGGSMQHDSGSTSDFFSDMLSRARPDKIWKPRNNSPVILMGSLPSTSL